MDCVQVGSIKRSNNCEGINSDEKIHSIFMDKRGSWGTKISSMSKIAEKMQCKVISVDYRGIIDPEDRIKSDSRLFFNI